MINRDLSRYKLVIAPMLYMLRGDIAERLYDFVQKGGVVVATYLTGDRGRQRSVFQTDAPGPLRALFGIWREEQDIFHADQSGLVQAVDGMRWDCRASLAVTISRT